MFVAQAMPRPPRKIGPLTGPVQLSWKSGRTPSPPPPRLRLPCCRTVIPSIGLGSVCCGTPQWDL